MMVAVAGKNATRERKIVAKPQGQKIEKSPALHRAFFISGELDMKPSPPILLDYVLV